ncbi:MAG TPA: AAA family ATPase, partial [Chloroflexaceae bacterium]|nr:AAA family ATPase [Chloroflexaceae bacterium]
MESSTIGHAALPFSALVGLDAARQALLLLAVDPGLGGVVVAAGVGTGKSTLVRAFARLLDAGAFVELPVGVTEDRLLGGLDLEATLARGERVHRSGLLARADGGLLYADAVNLLDDSTVNHLLATLDGGVVRVEREGLSVVEAARFALIATYDPSDGPPRRHLLDRVGLIAAPVAHAPAPARAEVVRRNLSHDRARAGGRAGAQADPTRAAAEGEFDDEDALLLAMVMAAREALPGVTIEEAQVRQLIQAALALGVEGHRADVFAARAALASAALAGREAVADEDLERAVRFVLLPRATRAPQVEEPPPPEESPPPEEPSPPESGQQDDEEQEDEPPPPPEELT